MGQMRALLLIGFAASVKGLSKILGSPLALLFGYAGWMWVLRNYQDHGLLHLTCVAAAIAAGKWLADQDSTPRWIVWLGAAQAVFGLAQWAGWNPWGYVNAWELGKPTAFMGQETTLGAFLAAALAPALFTRRYFSAATIFACILATKSSMSVAAGGAVALIWLYTIWPVHACALATFGLLIAAGGVAFRPHDPIFAMNLREYLWQLGLDAYRERPIFGWGPGSWQDRRVLFRGVWVSYVHSEPIELLAEYGRVGGVLALLALARFLDRWRFTWHHAMVVGLLVNSIGNFTFHLAASGTLFLLGWILSERRGRIEGCVSSCLLLSLRSYCTRWLGR